MPPPPRRPAVPAPPRPDPRRTRAEHAQETAEDYAELIAELADATGEARVTDLARTLRVSHVTVVRTLQRMRRGGLVAARPAIRLTAAGRALAEASRRRHTIVLAFLRALGVPPAAAQSDAEGIEHHVSRETLDAFVRHLARGGAGSEAGGARRPAARARRRPAPAPGTRRRGR